MKILLPSFILLLSFTLLFSTVVLAQTEKSVKETLLSLSSSITFESNLGENYIASLLKDTFPNLYEKNLTIHNGNLAGLTWKTGNMMHALEMKQRFSIAQRQLDYMMLNTGHNQLTESRSSLKERTEQGPDP
ncbi:hypothetical protein CR203_17330 [Salipaludibacillus neizhouensis]|uniref:Uncharacterized protein n=1 Tax=Salipaludibacillus neizhouensis TaxID=885475 RepID=A0A3A9KMV0_9BACI|nr:hypothetical protein [Salipaludibacillus neizhouensis]RKL66056.1 hypothetical protein CR203_17330 [Salipaludibacillus neizhouensis]